ncbi:MAG TPA: cytochrome c [Candidatus Eisenbacteria bacterium]|nr:cytochrome c [Candidatus Eisenbacteria bacterium]
MNRSSWVSLLILGFVLFVGGCGGGTSTQSSATTSAGSAADASGSQLNSGPKAIETVSINPGLADWGAKVFEKRACVTCHAIGQRKQGPDLAGVATRRTEAWMTKQIVDPEWMIKNDPISRQLFAEYALQMANQHVPEQEVKALIQFLVRESQKTAGASASATH